MFATVRQEERREFVGFGRSKAIECFCGGVADSEQCREVLVFAKTLRQPSGAEFLRKWFLVLSSMLHPRYLSATFQKTIFLAGFLFLDGDPQVVPRCLQK